MFLILSYIILHYLIYMYYLPSIPFTYHSHTISIPFSCNFHTIVSHVSVIKHTFRTPFSILNPVPYRIFRVYSEFNTPRALGHFFWWVFNESSKIFQYYLTYFSKIFVGFHYIHKKLCWFWFRYSYIWFIPYLTSYSLYFSYFHMLWATHFN